MKRKKIGISVLCVCVLLLLVYIGVAQYFKNHFLPNTTVNGMEASKKTVEEVENSISKETKKYKLTLKERENKKESITGDEIDLRPVFEDKITGLLQSQNPYLWPKAFFEKTTLESPTAVVYDKEKLQKKVETLACYTNQTAPKDAYISEYTSGEEYKIVPEEQGKALKEKRFYKMLDRCIINLKEGFSLNSKKCYQKPKITKKNKNLKKEVKARNQYISASVTHTFGDNTETLNGDTVKDWLLVDEDHEVYLSDEKVTEFVQNLASEHNTVFHRKTLKTSYGPTVTIDNGDYGWWIDKDGERAQLLEDLKSGKAVTREPVYRQKAASFGTPDYGSTYVEINLSAQHLFFYKNGSLVIDSDFVSGNPNKGNATPTGAYSITYKQRNATLKGADYNTPVDYWMPYCNNVGMHDANWRSSFGGTIYKSSGSHGCVNLPPSVAATIFERIEEGAPVLVYELPGTEPAPPKTAEEPKQPSETVTTEDTSPEDTSSGNTPTETTEATNGDEEDYGEIPVE